MQNLIPTAHNECANKDLIAKVVLMPGDPLRAKFIADTFLTDIITFNTVRGNYGYTGKYNGKYISVMASGMGMPSLGIYAYELYKFYDVDVIVRIGSCGAYDEKLNLYDLILVTQAYSESTFAKIAYGYRSKVMSPSKSINKKLSDAATALNMNIKEKICHSSDVFYGYDHTYYKKLRDEKNCSVVEMESFALFATAKFLSKKAACLLTVSDSFEKEEKTTSKERETKFKDMMLVALSLARKTIR